jgi:hypothetical protein
MGFTSAQRANGVRTAHYQFSYDETFSASDGRWGRLYLLLAS